jgi:hypothetical protein
MNTENCAYCNSTNTIEVEYAETFKINGADMEVAGMKLNHCNDCKSETVPMHLVDYNMSLFQKACTAQEQFNNSGWQL